MNTGGTDIDPPTNADDAPTSDGWNDDAPVVITASPAPLCSFGAPQQPDVSIVTVTFGVSPIQPRMWAALGSAGDDIANAEMIVVDNLHPRWGHSGGDLVSICTAGVHLARPDANLGFGGGNNLGVDRSRAEIICLLNPDVILAPGDLPRLVELARERPDDIIAPVLLNDDGSVQEMGGRISRDGTTRPIRTAGHQADYASAACWVMTRERYVELGGFDPIFYPAYYEDVDLALRLHQIGGTTYVDHETRVVHAWTRRHLHRVPDTRPQHRLLRERWAEQLAKRPALRKPKATTDAEAPKAAPKGSKSAGPAKKRTATKRSAAKRPSPTDPT